jgi:hypothetical protein
MNFLPKHWLRLPQTSGLETSSGPLSRAARTAAGWLAIAYSHYESVSGRVNICRQGRVGVPRSASLRRLDEACAVPSPSCTPGIAIITELPGGTPSLETSSLSPYGSHFPYFCARTAAFHLHRNL